MSAKKKIDFDQHSPFRRPDWRYERILKICANRDADGRVTPCPWGSGPYVKDFKRLYLADRGGTPQEKARVAQQLPGAYVAYMIYKQRNSSHDADRRLAFMLECRLLARQTNAEILAEMTDLGGLAETIDWYEAMFFNIRDRIEAHDWILDKALMPAIEEHRARAEAMANANARVPNQPLPPKYTVSDPYFDPLVKFLGYYGGPFVLELALSGFQNGSPATSREGTSTWLDRAMAIGIKERSVVAAREFEVSKYNVMELFQVHTQLMAIEKSDETDVNKNAQIHEAVSAMLGELKWATGTEGANMVNATRVGEFDNGAAELRDSEIHLLSAGKPPGTMKEVMEKRMREEKPQEAANGNSNVK